jgi:single-stranded DNA-binding protein
MSQKNLNQWIGEGNISSDPVVRYTTGSNRPVTNFTLYIDNTYKSKKHAPDGEVAFKKRTVRIPLVAWAAKAEMISKHYSKGDKVRVVGKLRTRPVVKADFTYSAFEVVIDNISLIKKASN